MDEAKRLGAIPYDVKNVELGHHGKECSFEAILKKYDLTDDPALVLLGKIVNGADTDNTLHHQPEGPGLNAVAEGFRHLGFKDDHAVNAAEWVVYDALYAYCQKMVRDGKPNGAFAKWLMALTCAVPSKTADPQSSICRSWCLHSCMQHEVD